jgi:hypothetical protein
MNENDANLAVKDAARVIGISDSLLRLLIAQKRVFARKRGVGKCSPWYVPLRLKQAYRVGLANV